MQKNRGINEKEQEQQGPEPDRKIDEALTKFQLQTGLGAGSPILSFMRLVLKASVPAGQPARIRRPQDPPPSGRQPEPAPESYKPITPTSSAWVLVMLAAALLGLLFSWLARTGALN